MTFTTCPACLATNAPEEETDVVECEECRIWWCLLYAHQPVAREIAQPATEENE